MAATLKSSAVVVGLQYDWQDPGPPPLVSTTALSWAKNFASGTGANAANKIIVKLVTLAGGAGADLDLSGVLADPGGVNTVALTKVRGVYVEHQTTANTAGVEFGPRGSASNPVASWFHGLTDALVVAPGGAVGIGNPTAAGYPVSNGSADTLHLLNLDGVNAATVLAVFVGE